MILTSNLTFGSWDQRHQQEAGRAVDRRLCGRRRGRRPRPRGARVVAEFRGLSGTAKQKKVLEATGLGRANLAGGENLSAPEWRELMTALRREEWRAAILGGRRRSFVTLVPQRCRDEPRRPGLQRLLRWSILRRAAGLSGMHAWIWFGWTP
jgi:hypothetical protein